MIYVDTSIVLAEVFSEDIKAHPELWLEPMVASRLMEYETWVRMHAMNIKRPLRESVDNTIRQLFCRISLLELHPFVLKRALEPFPRPVRTLDALHLASIDFLRSRQIKVKLATFDQRMSDAATSMGIPLARV